MWNILVRLYPEWAERIKLFKTPGVCQCDMFIIKTIFPQ